MKICTTCLVSRPAHQFYSKGNRLDASCKECVKDKRRTTYLAHRNVLSKSQDVKLRDAFALMIEMQTKFVDYQIQEVDRVINRATGNSI
jgi:hypothetical protein